MPTAKYFINFRINDKGSKGTHFATILYNLEIFLIGSKANLLESFEIIQKFKLFR